MSQWGGWRMHRRCLFARAAGQSDTHALVCPSRCQCPLPQIPLAVCRLNAFGSISPVPAIYLSQGFVSGTCYCRNTCLCCDIPASTSVIIILLLAHSSMKISPKIRLLWYFNLLIKLSGSSTEIIRVLSQRPGYWVHDKLHSNRDFRKISTQVLKFNSATSQPSLRPSF